ncbi:hypothetical protein BC828DRAFT_25420 [Blastocladiella britannica]|nr:hypothetical protein BC828DRAFT_25420 [Blastocladiella britannica]
MTTSVKFGSFLTASEQASAAKVVVGAKGTIDLAKLSAVAAVAPFSALDASVTAPLHLKEGSASSVTVWHKSGDALQQIVFAEYDNKLSRNMGIVRTDLATAAVASAVPAAGNVQLTLVVASAAEAYAVGLAAARNWPIYTRKTGSKAADRTVFVDFVALNGEAANVAEIQAIADGIRN